MGLTYAEIELQNMWALKSLKIRALADTGAVFMSIPATMARDLGYDLTEVSSRDVILANGARQTVPMIGPLRVHFAGRYCDLSALVLGDEPLIGAVPMEMMDLVVSPATQSLTVNPASPSAPSAVAKGMRPPT
jgi:clan AA aspartic protease